MRSATRHITAILFALTLAAVSGLRAQTVEASGRIPVEAARSMTIEGGGGRLLVTDDGGRSWRMLTVEQSSTLRVGSPVQLTRLAAATGWRTEDANTTASSSTVAIPNPASGSTTVHFTVDRACEATLLVFDPKGNAVARVSETLRHAGEHAVELDLGSIPTGAYYFRIVADGTLTRGGGLLVVH